VAATSLLSVAACGPSDPCRASAMRLVSRYSQRYVGHWAVARGDTLTLIQTGDRFKLREVVLDTDRVAVGRGCRLRGAVVFQAPRAETLAVTWVRPGAGADLRLAGRSGAVRRYRRRGVRGLAARRDPVRGARRHPGDARHDRALRGRPSAL